MSIVRIMFAPWLAIGLLLGSTVFVGLGAVAALVAYAHVKEWPVWKLALLLTAILMVVPDIVAFIFRHIGK